MNLKTLIIHGRTTTALALLLALPAMAVPIETKEAPKEFPTIKAVMAERTLKLEKDLAAKLMRRADTPAASVGLLELQIDLRIVQRWLVAQAIVAKPQGEMQIATVLRSMELAKVIAGLDESLKGPLSRTQTEAAGQVHKISFELVEPKDIAELDGWCKRLGLALENVASPTPVEPRSIPLMRPKPLDAGAEVSNVPGALDAPRTVAELSAEVTRVAVSANLRQQLLAVAKAAGSAAADPAQKADAAAIQQMLASGVDLAKGLSASTGLSIDARAEIETQLAEGLALFSDPRTRAAGKERVLRLNEYRNVMNRLARSKVPADLRRALAPAISNAQTHAEQGQKLLDAIDAYVAVTARFDAMPKRENPVANLRRATDDAAKQFTSARQSFITSANETGITPESLDVLVNDLSAAVDLYVMLDGMQGTYETLNRYKPRPMGAIETRTLKAAVAATAALKSPTRTDAMRYISDLNKLAQLSGEVTVRSLSDIPPGVAKAYAGISLADFEAKCKIIMGELVSQVAGGGEMDKTKVARLRSVGELSDTLRFAALAEKAVTRTGPLSRWVDWTLTSEQAQGLLESFQQQSTLAFGGFISESPDAVEKFLRERENFLPLVAFLNADAAYADQCAALPDGLRGDLAQLITPLDGQPFATERYVSYAAAVAAMFAATEPDTAAVASNSAMQRMSRDLQRAVRELRGSLAAKPVNSK